MKKEFNVAQKQAIIKLIEEGKDKTMSLLNVNYKITLKALPKRLKNIFSSFVSSKQTVYVRDRFIGRH